MRILVFSDRNDKREQAGDSIRQAHKLQITNTPAELQI
jgi:hypothetical protein